MESVSSKKSKDNCSESGSKFYVTEDTEKDKEKAIEQNESKELHIRSEDLNPAPYNVSEDMATYNTRFPIPFGQSRSSCACDNASQKDTSYDKGFSKLKSPGSFPISFVLSRSDSTIVTQPLLNINLREPSSFVFGYSKCTSIPRSETSETCELSELKPVSIDSSKASKMAPVENTASRISKGTLSESTEPLKPYSTYLSDMSKLTNLEMTTSEIPNDMLPKSSELLKQVSAYQSGMSNLSNLETTASEQFQDMLPASSEPLKQVSTCHSGVSKMTTLETAITEQSKDTSLFLSEPLKPITTYSSEMSASPLKVNVSNSSEQTLPELSEFINVISTYSSEAPKMAPLEPIAREISKQELPELHEMLKPMSTYPSELSKGLSSEVTASKPSNETLPKSKETSDPLTRYASKTCLKPTASQLSGERLPCPTDPRSSVMMETSTTPFDPKVLEAPKQESQDQLKSSDSTTQSHKWTSNKLDTSSEICRTFSTAVSEYYTSETTYQPKPLEANISNTLERTTSSSAETFELYPSGLGNRASADRLDTTISIDSVDSLAPMISKFQEKLSSMQSPMLLPSTARELLQASSRPAASNLVKKLTDSQQSSALFDRRDSAIVTQPVRTIASLPSPMSLIMSDPNQPLPLFIQALNKLNGNPAGLALLNKTLRSGTHLNRLQTPRESPEISPPDSLTSAPPSYSFVLRQMAARRPRLMGTFIPSPSFVQHTPPPNYATAFDIYVEPTLPPPPPRVYNFGFTSTPAVCPECGYAGLTSIVAKVTVCTHLCAAILCIFCCWICVPLPYILKSCKDVYHHCRNCRHLLGMYCPTNPESRQPPHPVIRTF